MLRLTFTFTSAMLMLSSESSLKYRPPNPGGHTLLFGSARDRCVPHVPSLLGAGVRGLWSQNIWAVLAVDGCAASAGDEADDLVSGHGVAATRHGGEHPFQPNHFYGVCGCGLRCGWVDFKNFISFFSFARIA